MKFIATAALNLAQLRIYVTTHQIEVTGDRRKSATYRQAIRRHLLKLTYNVGNVARFLTSRRASRFYRNAGSGIATTAQVAFQALRWVFWGAVMVGCFCCEVGWEVRNWINQLEGCGKAPHELAIAVVQPQVERAVRAVHKRAQGIQVQVTQSVTAHLLTVKSWLTPKAVRLARISALSMAAWSLAGYVAG